LGDDTGGAAVVRLPIMFRCAGVLISGGLPCTYTYTVDSMYTQFRRGAKFDFVRNLADRNYCVKSESVSTCMYVPEECNTQALQQREMCSRFP